MSSHLSPQLKYLIFLIFTCIFTIYYYEFTTWPPPAPVSQRSGFWIPFKPQVFFNSCLGCLSSLSWHITEFVPALFFVQQDSIQKILLSLTSRIAETHLIHEKRRILSMYRLFVLLLLKDLQGGLGDTWAFFIRDVIYSLLRIISDETQSKKQPRQQHVNLVVDDDLFLPCCNLIYYVCKAAVECCSQVG